MIGNIKGKEDGAVFCSSFPSVFFSPRSYIVCCSASTFILVSIALFARLFCTVYYPCFTPLALHLSYRMLKQVPHLPLRYDTRLMFYRELGSAPSSHYVQLSYVSLLVHARS